MGFQDFISESEAATVAGVSVSTLNRFAEAGYLQTESDNDGLRLFSKVELEGLFKTHDFDESPDERVHEVTLKSMEKPSSLDSVVLTPEKGEPISEESDFTTKEQLSNLVRSAQAARPAPSSEFSVRKPAVESRKTTEETEKLKREVGRLNHLLALHDDLLDKKEDELKDLRKQRDWLQTRVEKLEEKSERDQILLLAETQTIRSLLADQQRKSPIRSLVEWIGLLPPPPKEGSTIDMNNK